MHLGAFPEIKMLKMFNYEALGQVAPSVSPSRWHCPFFIGSLEGSVTVTHESLSLQSFKKFAKQGRRQPEKTGVDKHEGIWGRSPQENFLRPRPSDSRKTWEAPW